MVGSRYNNYSSITMIPGNLASINWNTDAFGIDVVLRPCVHRFINPMQQHWVCCNMHVEILVVINGMRCTLSWLMPDSRCMGIENGSGRVLL